MLNRSAPSDSGSPRGFTGCVHPTRDGHEHVHQIFESALFSIGESRCSGGSADRGDRGGYSTSQHVAHAHEIVIARRGAYRKETSHGTIVAHPGVALFYNPGDTYEISHPIPGGDMCSVFRLASEGARTLLGHEDHAFATDGAERFLRQDVSIDGRIYLAHRLALRAACASTPGNALSSMVVEERTMAFLHGLNGEGGMMRTTRPTASGRRADGRAREYVMRVREVIAMRFRSPLTLTDVARAVGCSPYHLTRIVSAHEGAPIYQLIIRHRLRHALEEVLATRNSLSAIALENGFASQSHFGDAFRREFGCAPGAVRRGGSLRALTERAAGVAARSIQ